MGAGRTRASRGPLREDRDDLRGDRSQLQSKPGFEKAFFRFPGHTFLLTQVANVSISPRLQDVLLDLKCPQCTAQLEYVCLGHRVGTPRWDGIY